MWAALIPLAYLLGTFPSANLVARASGVDIRTVGSGNPGASNVARSLGWRKGLWVFALDGAKGALAAAVGLIVAGRPAGYILVAAAIIGHVFPIWQGFRGGKGVATGTGGFAVLSPLVVLSLVPVWVIVSRTTKKASLASMAVVVLLPIGVGIVRQEVWEVLATIGLCGLVMIRHAGNIQRLASREENVLN